MRMGVKTDEKCYLCVILCHIQLTLDELMEFLHAIPSKNVIYYRSMYSSKVCVMLCRPICANFTTECLKMRKKWSIFKGCFLAVNGLKWGILAKNRHSGILSTLSFAENRKFLSQFVL